MSENAFVQTKRIDNIAIVRLNRPDVLNALSPEVLADLCEALEVLDSAPEVRVIVLTGGERAFAAGADITVLVDASSADVVGRNTRRFWTRIRQIQKVIIAAVSGFAYGGGCELAMLCDLIVASESARFAQPEIKVGIIPGAGGTQRLLRAVGQYRAMEMVLTGEAISAQEAYAAGLVNRVVPPERYLEEALSLARLIASRPPLAVKAAKQAMRHGLETTLLEGLEVERQNYVQLFDTKDQEEGMRAFLEKRPPEFIGE
ncbi:MAG TPA: enoyl-CoA hydratase-related protein [Anaerolineales bacterium]|nr:enoyl-CoA hydratase-related protein [Anaerolineales bacterium]